MTHHEILLFVLGADLGVYLTLLAYFGMQMVGDRRGRRALDPVELRLAKREDA